MCRNVRYLLILFLITSVALTADDKTFYTLNKNEGLSNDTVLQMTQLKDGRMLVVTPHSIDIYNGSRFEHIARDESHWQSLPGYHGATNLSVDNLNRLWIKDWYRVACYDLSSQQPIAADVPDHADDFFFDSDGRLWTLKECKLRCQHHVFSLPAEAGILQNIDVWQHQLYAFFHTGCVAVYNLSDNRLLTQVSAYDGDDISRYSATSTIQQKDGRFYQVRTGANGKSIFLCFNPQDNQWTTILRSDTYLHTLIVTHSSMAYVSMAEGYLCMNLSTGQSELFRTLRLPDGSMIHTGANTIYQDREGGIWLGTYHDGLLYSSPLSGVFSAQRQHIPLTPVLTDFYLHGERIRCGETYDGRVLLDSQPPYVHRFVLSHKQNAIAFRFSSMNYVHPRSTIYRYRFTGQGADWHVVSADSLQGMVSDQGVLYLSFVGLAPGSYRLEVMSTTLPDVWKGGVAVYEIEVETPWWKTVWANIALLIILLAIIGLIVRTYLRREQQQMAQQQREERLMMRVQQLVEQVNRYEHSSAMVVLSEPEHSSADTEEPEPTPQEKAFMARATRLVEENMSTPNYGVEQLAADLCMERTGLYKKLTAMMQQSPVSFIRSIRLHRAAALILQGEQSVSEIAEHTGFSSSSYFSKCFQKEFGCKPSEYKG